jgi:hypothetical protein
MKRALSVKTFATPEALNKIVPFIHLFAFTSVAAVLQKNSVKVKWSLFGDKLVNELVSTSNKVRVSCSSSRFSNNMLLDYII